MQGQLWEGVLPGVLRALYVGRETGVLTFQRGEERRSVTFRKGNIISADTNVAEGRMGAVLVRRGRLSATDLERASQIVLWDKKRLGEVLVELGVLNEDGLEEAVATHVYDLLGQVFAWNEGAYEFVKSDDTTPKPGEITLRFSTGELILQAARGVEDPDVVRYNLGDLNRVLTLSTDPLLRFQRISFTPVDGYILSRVDGTLSATEVIQVIPLPAEEIQRSLFGLLSTGVVEFAAGPPKKAPRPAEPARALPPRPLKEEEAVRAPERPVESKPAAEAHTPEAHPPPPSSPEAFVLAPPAPSEEETVPLPMDAEPPPVEEEAVAPLSPELAFAEDPASAPTIPFMQAPLVLEAPPSEAEALRRSILEAYDGLRTRTHFEVLGVSRDATDSQVREAYFRLAKRFHPDAHHDPALSDLRDKLEEVFNHLGEAYEVLRNPRIRASYEREMARSAGGAPGQSSGLTDVELAEESLRKASDSVARERYWEAIPLLESAVSRLEGPAKQRARILLARAYSRHPNWVKQGEELLHHVIRQDPMSIEAHYYLGLIFYDQGLRSRALAAFKKVLDIDPSNENAQAYVAALNPEGPPSSEGGLLKRLFRRT